MLTKHIVKEFDRFAKVVVVERHKGYSNVGLGLVDLDIKGSIASTIAHDSHHIIAIGNDDNNIMLAIDRVIDLKGGIVVVKDNKIIAELRLEIVGLVSNKEHEYLASKLDQVFKTIDNITDLDAKELFMALTFLALPVIPEIRVTDKGLINVNENKVIDVIN